MLRTAFVTTTLATALVVAGSAQSRRGFSGCNSDWNSRRASYCETRDATIPSAVNPLDIDAGRNGGIRIQGWDRADALIHAVIRAQADTDAQARALVAGVRIETAGGSIKATGPSSGDEAGWSANFELNVPRNAILTLNTQNGGISISDFRGSAQFHARNGGLTLTNVGGDLRGETTNGGVTVDLTGDHWDGQGLDVETRNGGLRLNVPQGYSAQLETGTTNGGLSIDFPINVQHDDPRRGRAEDPRNHDQRRRHHPPALAQPYIYVGRVLLDPPGRRVRKDPAYFPSRFDLTDTVRTQRTGRSRHARHSEHTTPVHGPLREHRPRLDARARHRLGTDAGRRRAEGHARDGDRRDEAVRPALHRGRAEGHGRQREHQSHAL